MTLYLYNSASRVPLLTIENVISYTADELRTEDGTVCSPLAEGIEFSSLPDCSETLRANWRGEHPSNEARIEELEELFALLLYGGEDE